MSPIKAGVCLHLTTSSNQTKHLYIVLNDPCPHGGYDSTIAVVNLSSTLDADKTVVLNAGDHPFVKRDSYVVYGKAKVIDAQNVEARLAADATMKHNDDCAAELLKRVREGVFKSPFSTPAFKDYCKNKFGELNEQLAQAPNVSGDS